MPSDFPINSGHQTLTSTCSTVSHSPITLTVYTNQPPIQFMSWNHSELWRPYHGLDLALTRLGSDTCPLGVSCGFWHQGLMGVHFSPVGSWCREPIEQGTFRKDPKFPSRALHYSRMITVLLFTCESFLIMWLICVDTGPFCQSISDCQCWFIPLLSSHVNLRP